MLNILSFILFYILCTMVIVGYGQLGKVLIFSKNKSINEIGIIGLFGYLFLYFISSTIHFFSNFSNILVTVIFTLGFFSFIFFLLNKKFEKNSIRYFAIILILFLPFAIIAEPNEDFFFYYQPYINYLQSTKIIFGIVNINNTLAFSTNSLYDILVLFNFNSKFNNGFSVPISIFYIFFISFLSETITKKFNFFNFIILFLSIVSFSKLRDFGTSIPPQLLLIIIICLTYALLSEGFKQELLTKIFSLLTLAIILRFNSIIILPLIIIIITIFYKHIFSYLTNNKKTIIFLFLVSTLFIFKNIIHSGCLIYPVSTLCFEEVSWSSNIKVTEQKYYKLQSDSKGWPYYAKEEFKIKDKFVWQNLNKEKFYSYNKYSKTSPLFWSKYWIKDPNYKKIVNLLIISILVLLILTIKNKSKIYSHFINQKNTILFLISIFIITFFWFYLSPQMRYGGYFCIIALFGTIITILTKILNLKYQFMNLLFLIVIAISYVGIKNINRISEDIYKDKFVNFPWPNNPKLYKNLDYDIFNKDGVFYNKRLRTNKLVFDNGNQAILMCGDIDFPCIPDGKEICLGDRKILNSYIFYSKNKNEDKCYEFMNKNILY